MPKQWKAVGCVILEGDTFVANARTEEIAQEIVERNNKLARRRELASKKEPLGAGPSDGGDEESEQ